MNMVSVFQNYSNYQHMVNSNTRLKRYALPYDILMPLGMAEVRDSPSLRQCSSSLTQLLTARQSMSCARMPKRITAITPNGSNAISNIIRLLQQQPEEHGHRRPLPLDAHRAGRGSAVYPRMPLTNPEPIDLHAWLQRFRILKNLILSIEPIRQLSSAFNFLTSLFQYFSMRFAYLYRNELIPRLRNVINPLGDRISHQLLAVLGFLDQDTAVDNVLIPRPDTKKDTILYIISSPCQTCLSLCTGQYPSLADALPPKAILSREQFLKQFHIRHVVRLGV